MINLKKLKIYIPAIYIFCFLIMVFSFNSNLSAQEISGPELNNDDNKNSTDDKPDNSWKEISEESENEAELLERRSEFLGAQSIYINTLLEVIKKASESKDIRKAKLLWARAEFLLEKSYSLALKTAQYDYFLKSISAINSMKHLAPFFKAKLSWLEADLYLKLAKISESQKRIRSLGIIKDWQVLGSFDNDQGRNFYTNLPPENELFDSAKKYKCLKSDSSWRKINTIDHLGFTDMKAFFVPGEDCLGYAISAVYSPKEKEIALGVASDDMISVFINQERVFSFDGFREAFFDQNIEYCKLQKGWNLVFVKIGQAKGDWKFLLRVTEKNGKPARDLKFSSEEKIIKAAYQTEAVKNKENVEISPPPMLLQKTPGKNEDTIKNEYDNFTDSIEVLKYTFQKEKDSRAGYYLGWLLTNRHSLGIKDKSNMHILLEASRLEPGRAIYYLAFAESSSDELSNIADRDENAKRLMLEKAVSFGKDEITARVELAKYYVYDMKIIDKALTLAFDAVKENPMCVDANTVIFDIYIARGWEAEAENLLNTVLKRQPSSLPLLLRKGALFLKQGKNREAYNIYSKALSQDNTVDVAIKGFVEAALRLGELEKLEKNIQNLLSVNPYNNYLKNELAGLYMRNKSFAEALKIADAELVVCPLDPDMIALKGEIFLRMGKKEQAVELWKQALKIQPAMFSLLKYIDFIEKHEENEYEEIDDLREYSEKYNDYPVKPGDNRLYLLYEKISHLNNDGTKSQVTHFIVKVLDEEAVKDLTSIPMPFEEDAENLEILEARVLRNEGVIESGKPITGVLRKDTYAYRYIQFSPLSPGDIIEVAYKTSEFRKGFFGDYFGEIYFFRRFFPAVVSRYILRYPGNRDVYIFKDLKNTPVIYSENKGKQFYEKKWEIKNLPAVELEPYMPSKTELSESVQASTFKNWDELCKWYWHLIKDQYRITPEIKRQLDFIIAGKETDEEKLDAIYSWVTTEVTNVGWEFGVHGYKPYNVGSVFKRRFGDCKDKAALVNVMAEYAGMKAYPVLLRAMEERGFFVGRGAEDITLPLFNHFNHCISFVETESGKYFLDATTNNRVITSIPVMDAGAEAVVVKENGAERIKLPYLTSKGNSWHDNTMLTISNGRNAVIRQEINASGKTAAFLRKYFGGGYDTTKLMEIFTTRLWGPTRTRNVRLIDPEDVTEDLIKLQTTVEQKNFCASDNGRISFKLPKIWVRGNDREGMPLPENLIQFAKESSRNYDLVIPGPFGMESTYTIRAPGGYHLAYKPEKVEKTYSFGRIIFSYNQEGSVIRIEKQVILEKPRINKDEYKNFRRFCQQADELDNIEIIMEKTK